MLASPQSRSFFTGCCLFLSALFGACQKPASDSAASIVFRHVPQPDAGGTGTVDILSGAALNSHPGARLIVYVYSRDSWYVQPLTLRPFTTIENDGRWKTLTHLGSKYAAVLATAGYHPANVLRVLPRAGGSVLSVKAVPGNPSSSQPPGHLIFSSNDWAIRQIGSDRYGTPHQYRMSNVTLDVRGYLHLRVKKEAGEWTCAEAALPNSLGYGHYDLVVRGIERLEPATVF